MFHPFLLLNSFTYCTVMYCTVLYSTVQYRTRKSSGPWLGVCECVGVWVCGGVGGCGCGCVWEYDCFRLGRVAGGVVAHAATTTTNVHRIIIRQPGG
jgi:hypothetical protein